MRVTHDSALLLPIAWLTWYLWSQLSVIVFACPFTKWIVLPRVPPPPFNNIPPLSMVRPLLMLQNDRVGMLCILWNCDAGDNRVRETTPLRLLRWWGQNFSRRRLCCDHHMAYWLLFTFCTVRMVVKRIVHRLTNTCPVERRKSVFMYELIALGNKKSCAHFLV